MAATLSFSENVVYKHITEKIESSNITGNMYMGLFFSQLKEVLKQRVQGFYYCFLVISVCFYLAILKV